MTASRDSACTTSTPNTLPRFKFSSGVTRRANMRRAKAQSPVDFRSAATSQMESCWLAADRDQAGLTSINLPILSIRCSGLPTVGPIVALGVVLGVRHVDRAIMA